MQPLMQNNLSRAEMTAQMRELLVMELAGVIALRLSAKVVKGAHRTQTSSCLAACGSLGLRRYATLCDRLSAIDVEPVWEPSALRGLSDRLATELQRDRSADALASRALVDVLALAYRYEELARTARHALDQTTKELLATCGSQCDRQAAALAQMIELVCTETKHAAA